MTRPLRALKGSFIVPDYQRGYRWTEEQITPLLDDLVAFAQQKQNKKSIYFLQPLVVCGDADLESLGPWEVIDGQQRLTTLYLMSAVLSKLIGRNTLLSFDLSFESRPGSDDLLRRIVNDEALPSISIIDDIDQFHIHQAWRIMFEYFRKLKEQGGNVDDIYSEMAGYVHVLWHVIPRNGTATVEHFTRLNMGRIALTGAELSRAHLLNPARHNMDTELHLPAESQAGHAEATKTLLFQRRQILMGSRWDDMERSLRDPGFWAFLGGQEGDSHPTRIDFLLDIYTGKPDGETREYYAFHQLEAIRDKDAQHIWDDITHDYQLLRSWYEDHDMYHWMGYLIRQGKRKVLRELLTAARTVTKSAFIHGVHERIRKTITTTGEIPDLDVLKYGEHNNDISRILLLFNVEYTRNLQNAQGKNSEFRHLRRFPFGLHSSKKWSLEHIEAQNVEGLKRVEDWMRWIGDHKMALASINVRALSNASNFDNAEALNKEVSTREQQRKNLLNQCDDFLERSKNESDGKLFLQISEGVLKFIGRLGKDASKSMHSLGNMALLDVSSNSKLNNAIFLVKRTRLLGMMKNGDYVPPATEAVFMRYYSQDGDVLPYWSEADRQGYVRQIRQTLSFFWPELALLEDTSCAN